MLPNLWSPAPPRMPGIAWIAWMSFANGPMLAAGATERHHKILEVPALVFGDAGVDERKRAREKLVNALLLVEIFDDGSVASGQSFEALFTAGIGQAATVEDEAAAVAAFVLGPAAVKGKAENSDDQSFRPGRRGFHSLRRGHALERLH